MMIIDRPEFSYIGRLPCGCVVAVTLDYGDKDTAVSVADFIKHGLTIERVTHEYVREHFIDIAQCPHRQPKASQQALFAAAPSENSDGAA